MTTKKPPLRLVNRAPGEVCLSKKSGPVAESGPPRPPCPREFTKAQRLIWGQICKRLSTLDLLNASDYGDLRALTLAEDRLRETTEYLNENGTTFHVVKMGRPYRCPACEGTGIRRRPKGSPEPPKEKLIPLRSKYAGGSPCSVCRRRNAAEIDAALQNGDSLGVVAKRFGVSKAAVNRHKLNHLPAPADTRTHEESCRACAGKGAIVPKERVERVQYPEVTQQRYAIEQVSALSSKLGLDQVSRTRIKGKSVDKPAAGGLSAMVTRAAALRR